MTTVVFRRYAKVIVASFVVLILTEGLAFFAHGIRARTPGKWETRSLTLAKHRLLVGGKTLTNPLSPTAENRTEGQHTFSHFCFACHGLDGQNTGVPFADAMSPPVPSLASAQVQNYTDGQLYWVIRNGLWPSGMPASRGILTDEEIWSIVVYVRHLPAEGSLGEPQGYSGEDCASTTSQVDHSRGKSANLPSFARFRNVFTTERRLPHRTN
jgi:mono/diheme cytochrome c family protein